MSQNTNFKLEDIESAVIANSNSGIYHHPKCHCVPQILGKHIVDIDLAHYDSKGRSYRPCAKCLGEIKRLFNDDPSELLAKGQSILATNSNRCLNNLIDSVVDETEEIYGLAWNKKQDHRVEEAL